MEGIVSQHYLAHDIAKECDTLKSLPLGAQILRCVGRAYRHCGQGYLRRYRISTDHIWKTTTCRNTLRLATLDITDSLHIKIRDVQSLATAALASGRLLLEESVYSWRKKQKNRMSHESMEYPNLGHVSDFISMRGSWIFYL